MGWSVLLEEARQPLAAPVLLPYTSAPQPNPTEVRAQRERFRSHYSPSRRTTEPTGCVRLTVAFLLRCSWFRLRCLWLRFAPGGTACKLARPAPFFYLCACRVCIRFVYAFCRIDGIYSYCSHAGICWCRTVRSGTCRHCARRGNWSCPHPCIPCMRSGCGCARICLSPCIACTNAARCRGCTFCCESA